MPFHRQNKVIEKANCNECEYPWSCREGLKRNFQEDTLFGVQNVKVFFCLEIIIPFAIYEGKILDIQIISYKIIKAMIFNSIPLRILIFFNYLLAKRTTPSVRC